MLLYHVTTDDSLKSIFENGLVPQIGRRAYNLNEPFPKVFFFRSISDVLDGVGNWMGEEFDEESHLFVLVIEVEDPSLVHPTFETEESWEFFSTDAIPPEWIKLCPIELN